TARYHAMLAERTDVHQPGGWFEAYVPRDDEGVVEIHVEGRGTGDISLIVDGALLLRGMVFDCQTSELLTPEQWIRQSAEAAPWPALTAPEVVAGLFAALADDEVDRAVAMPAPPRDEPIEAMRDYYQRMAKHFQSRGTPQVVAHVELGDAAVVVFRKGGDG